MVDQQNLAVELQGLIERQFDYMPSIVRQEMHNELLSRLSEWLKTYKACGKKSMAEPLKQLGDIESFLSVGVQGITGCKYMYSEKPNIQDIIEMGKKKQDEKKICD